MKPIRIGLTVLLASLSLPALAAEPSGTVDDPTWPAIERPAPAVSLNATGGEAAALRAADPTWPEVQSAAPVILLQQEAGAPQIEQPANWAPGEHYAVELAPQTARVAAAR